MRSLLLILLFVFAICRSQAMHIVMPANDSASKHAIDTTITFKDVNYYIFKNPADQEEFYKDLQRIRVVMPYVKMARHLYTEAQEEKEADSRKDYKHFRKATEKDLRAKFEKDVKNLYINEGKVLFKLLSRETGASSYKIIKDVKGGFSAFTYQIVAKHYTYDLKEKYDPHKEWILEMAVKYMGKDYDAGP